MLVNLVSWEHCRTLLDLSPKEKVFTELLIFSASAEIETYTGRKLKQREIVELHDGSRQNEITLKQYPVKEVKSLKVDNKRKYPEETKVNTDYYTCYYPQDDDYEHQSDLILADGYTFPKGRNNIEVIYTAGYLEEELPEDLKTAVVEQVEWLYKRIHNRQIGEINLEYGKKTQIATRMPEHVIDLIAPYKRKHW